MEIDRVVLSPAQRRVEGRPGQRRAGRHVVLSHRPSMTRILLVRARPG